MIFKVSFKETPNNPSKAVYKAGRVTNVILKGVVELPNFWHLMPPDICEWVATQTKVELYEDMANNTLIIHSEGTAKCKEEDKYDSILGERIAESRAKYCIYKFFYGLCLRLSDYYGKIMFGNNPVAATDNKGLMGCLEKYKGLCIRESHHVGELLASKENG